MSTIVPKSTSAPKRQPAPVGRLTGPMTAWWKVLGQPVLTPEVQKKLIDSVRAEVGSRSVQDAKLTHYLESRT